MTNGNTSTRVNRDARLRWVAIEQMKVNPLAQRELVPTWVDHIAANFDPEDIGTPVVSWRDGHYYIIDGQHRIAALKQIGWGDQQIQCWVYEGLTEAQESERFLKLNNSKAVEPHAKFRAAVVAGRDRECEIDRVVRAQGLTITREKVPGGIGCVTTVCKSYDRAGSATLGRALRISRDAYGDPGLEGPVVEGLVLLCQRYNGDLDDEVAKKRLGDAHGGVNGLLNKAQTWRAKTGQQRAQCVAAAAVDIINAGKGGKKLTAWWKS